ncbi:MAG: hypothetical protein P8182_06090 [Deltaproteobacteria bacterium]
MPYLSQPKERVTGTILLNVTMLLVCGCLILVSKSSLALNDPLPPEIRDLKLGISSSELIDKIKNSGSYSEGPVPKRETRIRLTWIPAHSARYKNVQFDFTEKDRLYLVRFVIKDKLRWKSDALKRAFFERFHITTENPGRMRVKDNDVVIYLPENKAPFFFDVTNTRTGQKIFEIFDKNISGRDRPRVKRRKKAGAKTPVRTGVPEQKKEAK